MQINNFIEELKKINIEIDDNQLKQLEKYYELLIEWNEKINLTGITEKDQVYLKHYYDSLTICKIIDLAKVNTLCDVGTGAGFPGMVLKIVFPNLKVTLVDSLNKRIEFLKEVANTLNLEDIEIIHDRAEDFALKNREKFDIVTARAVAKLNTLLEYCIPMVKLGKYFIPLKANIDMELEQSQNAMKELNISIENKISFLLPIENSNRTIIKFKKNKLTSKKYPRKYAVIKNKPL